MPLYMQDGITKNKFTKRSQSASLLIWIYFFPQGWLHSRVNVSVDLLSILCWAFFFVVVVGGG